MQQKLERSHSGMTLVEIMMVVVLIGLLASIALPAYQYTREKSQNAAFINDMRVFSASFEQYILENGAYPVDAPASTPPPGMEDSFAGDRWASKTSVGGSWDYSVDAFGIKAGFGVVQPVATVEQMQRVDEEFDDADLSTGRFRRVSGDRYYFVINDLP